MPVVGKQPVRVSTPSSKPSSGDGPKSPDHSKGTIQSKTTTKPGLPPKKPLTTARSSPSVSARERTDRSKPMTSSTTSIAKRPLANATAPTSTSARRTSTISSNNKPTTHTRTNFKLGPSKSDTSIKDTPKKAPESTDGADGKGGENSLPENEDVRGADTIGDIPKAAEVELQAKNTAIEELQQKLQEAQNHQKKELDKTRAEVKAQNVAKEGLQQELQALQDRQAQTQQDLITKDVEIGALQESVRADANKRERAFSDAASRHQQELRDVIARNEDRAKAIRARHVLELQESQSQHEQQRQAAAQRHEHKLQELVSQHDQRLQRERAAHNQERENLVAMHQLNLDSLKGQDTGAVIALRHEEETKEKQIFYERELEDADSRHGQQLKRIGAQNKQQLEEAHREKEDMQETILKFQKDFSDRDLHHRQQMDVLESRLKNEREKASREQEGLQDDFKRHRDQSNEAMQRYERAIAETEARLNSHLNETKADAERKLKETVASHEGVLADATTKHQEQLYDVHNQLKAESHEKKSLQAALKKADSERIASEEDLAEHHRDFVEAAVAKHQKETTSLRNDTNALTEELDILRARFSESKTAHDNDIKALMTSHERNLEEQNVRHEQAISDSKVKYDEELASLHRQYEVQQTQNDQQTVAAHEEKLKSTRVKHENELSQLQNENELLHAQLTPLTTQFETAAAEQSKAVAKFEQECGSIRRERDEAIGRGMKAEKTQETLIKERDEAIASRDKAEAEYEKLNRERDEAIGLRTKSDKSQKLLQAERDEAIARRTDIESSQEVLSKERDEAIKARMKADSDQETLRRERDEAIAIRTKGGSSQIVTDFEKNDLIKNAQVLRRALDGKHRECEELTAKFEAAKKELLAVKEPMQNIEQDHVRATTAETKAKHVEELRHLQEQHMRTMKDMAKLQQTLKSMNQERDDANAEIDSLQGKLKALLAEHLEAKKDLVNVHEEALRHERNEHQTTPATHNKLKQQHSAALQKIEELNQQLAESTNTSAKNSDQLHADLRKYMATLKQQYGTDVADLEALRKDIDAAGEKREEDWKKQEEMRAVIAAELEQILGEEG